MSESASSTVPTLGAAAVACCSPLVSEPLSADEALRIAPVLKALDEPGEALDVADAARRYLCAMLLSMPDEALPRSAGGEGQGESLEL